MTKSSIRLSLLWLSIPLWDRGSQDGPVSSLKELTATAAHYCYNPQSAAQTTSSSRLARPPLLFFSQFQSLSLWKCMCFSEGHSQHLEPMTLTKIHKLRYTDSTKEWHSSLFILFFHLIWAPTHISIKTSHGTLTLTRKELQTESLKGNYTVLSTVISNLHNMMLCHIACNIRSIHVQSLLHVVQLANALWKVNRLKLWVLHYNVWGSNSCSTEVCQCEIT